MNRISQKVTLSGDHIQLDFTDIIVFQKVPSAMFPRPCRGGDRGGVSDIVEEL